MNVDVIILSKTSPDLETMTRQCVSSLRRSEPGQQFNIILVESMLRWMGKRKMSREDAPNIRTTKSCWYCMYYDDCALDNCCVKHMFEPDYWEICDDFKERK